MFHDFLFPSLEWLSVLVIAKVRLVISHKLDPCQNGSIKAIVKFASV